MSTIVVFFFQAEDGIRDHCVTGVQTCALPICRDGDGRARCVSLSWRAEVERLTLFDTSARRQAPFWRRALSYRSEERRVGEEGRSRWWPDHLKKKKNKYTDGI